MKPPIRRRRTAVAAQAQVGTTLQGAVAGMVAQQCGDEPDAVGGNKGSASGPACGGAYDGPANDGSANDGPANDGSATDGPANDGSAKDGPVNDGLTRDPVNERPVRVDAKDGPVMGPVNDGPARGVRGPANDGPAHGVSGGPARGVSGGPVRGVSDGPAFEQSRISRAERLFTYDVIDSHAVGCNSNKQNDPIDDALRGHHALASLPAGI